METSSLSAKGMRDQFLRDTSQALDGKSKPSLRQESTGRSLFDLSLMVYFVPPIMFYLQFIPPKYLIKQREKFTLLWGILFAFQGYLPLYHYTLADSRITGGLLKCFYSLPGFQGPVFLSTGPTVPCPSLL